jgi:hypothetical protein
MKTLYQSIQLPNTATDERIVKSGALIFFRTLRTATDYIAKIPAVATQAATDIAAAWKESSRPKA